MLIGRPQSAWVAAGHRFFEVSIGIAAALAMAILCPERSAETTVASLGVQPKRTTKGEARSHNALVNDCACLARMVRVARLPRFVCGSGGRRDTSLAR